MSILSLGREWWWWWSQGQWGGPCRPGAIHHSRPQAAQSLASKACLAKRKEGISSGYWDTDTAAKLQWVCVCVYSLCSWTQGSEQFSRSGCHTGGGGVGLGFLPECWSSHWYSVVYYLTFSLFGAPEATSEHVHFNYFLGSIYPTPRGCSSARIIFPPPLKNPVLTSSLAHLSSLPFHPMLLPSLSFHPSFHHSLPPVLLTCCTLSSSPVLWPSSSGASQKKSSTLGATAALGGFDDTLPSLEKAKLRQETRAVAHDSKLVVEHPVSISTCLRHSVP